MPDTYERNITNITSVRDTNTINKAPLFNETLAQLRSHRQLRNLSITMHTGAYHDILQKTAPLTNQGALHWTAHVNCDLVLNFGGFQNLTSLRLGNISRGPQNLSKLADELACTLVASPNLRDLTLGFCHISTSQFTLKLCKSYVAAGGKPLSLRSLSLGHGRRMYDPEIIERDPAAANIPQLCDHAALERVMLFDDLSPLPHSVRDWSIFSERLPCDFPWSIRRFSAARLDGCMMSFIEMIGHDPTLPPHFMSEMLFAEWEYCGETPGKLDFNEGKRTYWPKTLSIERFIPRGGFGVGVRRRVIQQLYQWKGLTRLHIPVDLSVQEDRVSTPAKYRYSFWLIISWLNSNICTRELLLA